MNVYFISGFCTSCSIYSNVPLPPRFNKIYLDWLEPEPDEPLVAYAKRLTAPVDTTKPFALVGLSFGGMVAQVALQWLKPEQVIIISSVTSHRRIPALYRATGRLRLYKTVTRGMVNTFRPVVDWFIGAKRNPEELAMLHKTVRQLSPRLLRWSMEQVTLRWKQDKPLQRPYHIHGANDRLLPVGSMKPDVLIKGGSHFMIVSHGKEIGDLIAKRLGEVVEPAVA